MLASIGPSHPVSGDTRITFSTDAIVELTDNVDLSPAGEEEGAIITTLSPGFNLIQNGARVNGVLNYRLDLRGTKADSEEFEALNNIQGKGTAELLEDLLFLDGQVLTRQALNDPGGRVGSSDAVGRGNRSEVTALTISPSLRNQFADYGDGELRYTQRQVLVSGSAAGNSTQTTETARFTTGPGLFDRFRLTSLIEHSNSETDSDTRRDLERYTAEQSIFYPLNRSFALLGMGGYEKIDTGRSDLDTSGLIWSVGFDWHPSPRTAVRISGGERFGGGVITGDISYQITPRVAFRARYDESIGTSLDATRLGQLDVATGIEPGLIRNQIFDPETGLPVLGTDRDLGLDDEVFRAQRLSASLSAAFDRQAVTLLLLRETREFGNGATASRPEQTITSVSGSVSHRLQRDLSLDLTVNYRNLSGSSPSDTIRGQTTLRQQLTQDLSASIAYSRAQRFADSSDDEYTENAILVVVRQVF